MRVRTTLMVVVSMVAIGCADTVGDDGDDGWKLGDNNGTSNNDTPNNDTPNNDTPNNDTPNNDTPNNDDGEPGPVTFRLINGHTEPVFAYFGVGVTNPCGSDTWLDVFDQDEPVRIQDDCSLCECGAQSCAICGAPRCAPGADESSQIGVGGERTFEWDGMVRVRETDAGGNACLSTRPPEAETLTAQFCWGYAFETTMEPFGDIEQIECVDVEFSPGDRVVEHTIQPTTRDRVEFELVNSTGRLLYANTSVNHPCETGSWLHLSQGGQELQTSLACGQCLCTEVDENDMCDVACPGIACAPSTPVQMEFQPGEQRSHAWNRVAYSNDSVDGTRCFHDRLVTGTMTARFCWGEDVSDQTAQINDYICDTVEFDPYEDRRVTYEITDP